MRSAIQKGADGDTLLDELLMKPAAAESCSNIIASVEQLAEVLNDPSNQPPPEDSKVSLRTSKTVVSPLLLKLLSAVSKCWSCSYGHPHRAALLLSTYRTLPKNDDPVSFTLLISQAKPKKTWKETSVTVTEQM